MAHSCLGEVGVLDLREKGEKGGGKGGQRLPLTPPLVIVPEAIEAFPLRGWGLGTAGATALWC